MNKEIIFILYVADQLKSKLFYMAIFGNEPILDVPGMTEFQLAENSILGIMPESGIVKILGNHTPHPNTGNGIPRCELYLYVTEPKNSLLNAINAGAKLISKIEARTWGDEVAYCSDLDGHIIAFAKKAV